MVVGRPLKVVARSPFALAIGKLVTAGNPSCQVATSLATASLVADIATMATDNSADISYMSTSSVGKMAVVITSLAVIASSAVAVIA